LLRARLMHDLRAAGVRDRPRSRFAVRPWRWLSTAAAILTVAGGTWWLTARPDLAMDLAAREAVSGHIRSLMASHLTDVASTDQHTVKPWFGGKLDFSPPVTDFAATGFPLVGGRLDYLQGRPVAALVYMRHRHVINVFVWPVAGTEERFTPTRSIQGFHVIQGAHAGMTYRIVSDLNAEELAGFARLLAAPSAMLPQDSVLPPR
jgi:anti-sigma factor RsiW